VARIVVASWMVRYPLGGNLSWTLQWLVGCQQLGHEVYLVEKADGPNACWDPSRGVLSDDGSYGTSTVHNLLSRFGLGERWCFVDVARKYGGLERSEIAAMLQSADLLIDIGNHGAWHDESQRTGLRILVDGEPGATQMKWENKLAAGEALPQFDHYFSNGASVGAAGCAITTVGKTRRPLFNPVVPELFEVPPPPQDAPFTTVMNWQAHGKLVYRGQTYGQKDVEFQKFISLPRRTTVPLEVAVAGRFPRAELAASGWRIKSAHDVTASYDAYRNYIAASQGEFSVAKQVYVATHSGWFSDRSAAYLAVGRPVVLQETGFSQHLPCGRGLFAVRSIDEAAAALEEIHGDYARHSAWAREVAREHLDARVVLGRLLSDLDIGKGA
jgi:hypothetical protein